MTNDEFQVKSQFRNPNCSYFEVALPKAAVNAPHSRRFAKLATFGKRVGVWSAVASAPLLGGRTTRQDLPTPALRNVQASGFGFLSSFVIRHSSFIIITLLVALSASSSAATNDVYLFSFFREPNGQAGLFLTTSQDGLTWTELQPPNGKSFLEPQVGGKLMRDPCLRRGPDGVFHMVWTTSWGRPPVFGYASSTDLVHWSAEQAVPVMENDPTAKNVWAPELFYDDTQQQWLVFWATTIPGKFRDTENSGDGNHRIYYVTTKDFTKFSPTKLLYDGGFNVIDATMLAADGKYYLIVKDETKNPVKKNLRLAVGQAAEGPFGPAGEPISKNWVEGPTAIKIGGEYYIYFDHYTNPQYYGAIKSTDLKTWQDVSPAVTFPKGIRHGTVLTVPASIIEQIQTH